MADLHTRTRLRHAIRDRLLAEPAVTALVGDRVWAGRVRPVNEDPRNGEVPAILVDIADWRPDYEQGHDEPYVRIDALTVIVTVVHSESVEAAVDECDAIGLAVERVLRRRGDGEMRDGLLLPGIPLRGWESAGGAYDAAQGVRGALVAFPHRYIASLRVDDADPARFV